MEVSDHIMFKSRKDGLFTTIIFAAIGLMLVIMIYQVINHLNLAGAIALLGPIFLVTVLLGMIYYRTHYRLTQQYLYYTSGVIKGKILLSDIREVVLDKTLWVGLRPATARKGLIIKYKKYDEPYISPESNEKFVAALLERSPGIKVTH